MQVFILVKLGLFDYNSDDLDRYFFRPTHFKIVLFTCEIYDFFLFAPSLKIPLALYS
ncbi:MAG: hypothetical protein IH784_10120 [Bacteroidetes bacterium]|nr:hypothetical protein [Bacteroidota bacterium]